MSEEAKRIQRKRTKGWRMPEGAVYVGRPSRWGNPCKWYPNVIQYGFDESGATVRTTVTPDEADREARMIATAGFRDMCQSLTSRAINRYPTDDEIREHLAGRDLACWCPIDQPCHADALLEIANS